jgi:cytochrome c
MKLSSVSSLWDYINRAMPWNAPKSLTTDEVYAVTAYILNLGGIVPDDFVLSHRNIAEVQNRLPNRHGKTTQHALWPGRTLAGVTKPDVQGSACMANCAAEPKVASFMPDDYRNSHGNLADQNRLVGPQRGIATAGTAAPSKPDAHGGQSPIALATQHACVACHGVDSKLVGPSFRDIAARYGSRTDAAAYLAGKVKSGGSGVWGAIPMPPQGLPDADAKTIAEWLAAGAK